MSQQKYIVDILSEASMLRYKVADTPIDLNLKLLPDQWKLLEDPRYKRLVGKLNYLIIARPNIVYPINVVSQFMSTP